MFVDDVLYFFISKSLLVSYCDGFYLKYILFLNTRNIYYLLILITTNKFPKGYITVLISHKCYFINVEDVCCWFNRTVYENANTIIFP